MTTNVSPLYFQAERDTDSILLPK